MVKKAHQNPDGGLNQAGRDYYKRKEGANLKPPAPNPRNEKDAARRKSFCARMGGVPGPMKDEKGRSTRKVLALKAWKC